MWFERLDPAQLTIVVPTRNEAGNLPGFLASLPPDIPLILVDASDDVTPDLALALRPARTLVLRFPVNVTRARQIGAEAADAPWLLFTDADIAFAPDYFARLARRLATADAVYGPKRSDAGYRAYYAWFARGQALLHRLGVPAVSGSNLLVRAEAFRAVGGFDLDLSVNEDSELGWRLKRRGWRVEFAPELVVLERDHRRLRRGVWAKTFHSLARCALLYAGVLPRRLRRSDWGYWRPATRETTHGARS